MTEYIILMPLAIMIFGLTPVVARDAYLNKKQRHLMLGIIGLIFLLVLQNVTDYILQTAVFMPNVRMLVSVFGYCIRPVIIVLFCKLVKPDGKTTAAWILIFINTAVYLTAIFLPVVFYIDRNNHYHGGILDGRLSYTAFVISCALLFHLGYCTVTTYREKKSWLWVAIANVGLIILSALLDISPAYRDYPVSYVTISVVCCSLFYYIWLHLEFVEAHEKALMAEQRIKIMMSQIQPHFLYNTLSTIQALCLMDPKKAFETTEKFGSYLRNNIDYLDQPDLIPLQKELEHTRVYADIERLRFPKIRVEYRIEADDFLLPALTIQPLVENAIRHGVRGREHGLVTVTTRADGEYYEITIADNGIGFDTRQLYVTDGSHIGLSNVKERIEKMCDGTIHVESQPDSGTVITIQLPRRTE